jgi:hypothetical protein
MIQVTVKCDASKGMELVRELRGQGLVQGKDFDFTYYPYSYNNFTGESSQKCVIFTFYTEKYGTFYALKWS